jgi:hypothetical protein
MTRAVLAGFLGALVTLGATSSALAQDGRTTKTIQKSFAQGGTAHLDLSAGEYRITASPDDRITITAHVRQGHASVDEINLTIDIKGTRATVLVDGPSNHGVDVDIALPRRTHMVATLSAGEMKLSGIEGSKDISARAGELNVDIGDRERYRHVEASVKVGELNAPKFNVRKEGLFRSFEWNGKGSYELSVSLWAGELTLN